MQSEGHFLALAANAPYNGSMKLVPVAAALIVLDNKVLIGKRKTGSLAGLWEFPGGKIEEGETPSQCLVREIEEELGMVIETGGCLAVLKHTYPKFEIELHAYWASPLQGTPQAREHSELAWVAPHQLGSFELAPADVPLIELLIKSNNIK